MATKTKKIQELRAEIELKFKEFETLFLTSNLGTVDLDEKIEEVDSLIDHVNQRIHYTESRITRIVTFSVTLIAIGMAFFAVTVKLQGLSFYLGLIATGLLILTGGITSIIHASQVNPKYPFRALENDWKWFYPRIVDERYEPSMAVWETERKYLEKRLLHGNGLVKYGRKIIDEDKVQRLKVDIQQLYLLHVNEKYKNCFLTSLRRVLTWGLILISIVVVALFVTITAEHIKASKEKGKATQAEEIRASTSEDKTRVQETKPSENQRKPVAKDVKRSPKKLIK